MGSRRDQYDDHFESGIEPTVYQGSDACCDAAGTQKEACFLTSKRVILTPQKRTIFCPQDHPILAPFSTSIPTQDRPSLAPESPQKGTRMGPVWGVLLVSKPYCGVDGALKTYFSSAPRGRPSGYHFWPYVAPAADPRAGSGRVPFWIFLDLFRVQW